MKTKDVPAMVMLLAGGVYCLFGILYKIPLTEFLIQLLVILLVFWIFGGILKMILDHFMGDIGVKKEEEDSENSDSEGEDTDTETEDVLYEDE